MSNLTPEQEAINRSHNQHQARGQSFNPDCLECNRQRNIQPITYECNFCNARLPAEDPFNEQAARHNQMHLNHPETITK